MSEFESIGRKEKMPQNTQQFVGERRRFGRVVRSLSPENQDFLSEMTSILTEPDIYNLYKSDKDRLEGLRDSLNNMGLNEGKIKIVFRFFNFPYIKKT